jgi:tetratricopeptide (TPR) repeat protein
MRFWFALALFTAAVTAPAGADVMWYVLHQRQMECDSPGMYEPEVSIRGCTMIIRSVSATPLQRSEAYRKRGDRFRSLNDLDAALADYDQAIRYDAMGPIPLARRGDIYVRRGQFALAEADFTEVIAMRPDRDYGFAGRCRARAYGNMPGARADCDTAVRLRATNPSARSGRGVLNLREGAFDAAWSDFDAAYAADGPRATFTGAELRRCGWGARRRGEPISPPPRSKIAACPRCLRATE